MFLDDIFISSPSFVKNILEQIFQNIYIKFNIMSYNSRSYLFETAAYFFYCKRVSMIKLFNAFNFLT